MKSLVLYKSQTGFTKKYAEWIAEELNCEIFEVSKVNCDILKDYDNIIFGGRLHAVGIDGVKFIKKNLSKLKSKKIAVFATGATPNRKETIEEIINKNFNEDEKEKIRFFYFRGGFDYKQLNIGDKILMNLLKLKILKKDEKHRTNDEKGMLCIYNSRTDYTRRESITNLIEYIKSK